MGGPQGPQGMRQGKPGGPRTDGGGYKGPRNQYGGPNANQGHNRMMGGPNMTHQQVAM